MMVWTKANVPSRPESKLDKRKDELRRIDSVPRESTRCPEATARRHTCEAAGRLTPPQRSSRPTRSDARRCSTCRHRMPKILDRIVIGVEPYGLFCQGAGDVDDLLTSLIDRPRRGGDAEKVIADHVHFGVKLANHPNVFSVFVGIVKANKKDPVLSEHSHYASQDRRQLPEPDVVDRLNHCNRVPFRRVPEGLEI